MQEVQKGNLSSWLKGNKLHDGKKCHYEHPKYCIKYCRNGNQQKLGCNKGANCNFFHPVLCKNSVKSKVCTNIECKFIHLKGTRRKKVNLPVQDTKRELRPLLKMKTLSQSIFYSFRGWSKRCEQTSSTKLSAFDPVSSRYYFNNLSSSTVHDKWLP